MLQHIDLQLARVADATAIARMARDLIEVGLGWSWTPARVADHVRSRDSVVLVARAQCAVAGFAIMQFMQETAHLNLFAVARSCQRRGLGTRMLRWLEASANVAGIATIQLEVRTGNRAGRAFYKSAGYEEAMLIPGYYRGRESALRMARFLRMNEELAGLIALRHNFVPGQTRSRIRGC
jgi:ribosomal protein S18 acetylase RimI-like enzyme